VAQIIERGIIMIKKTYLSIALMIIVLLTVLSCGNKSIPGGPYDATPTPAQPLHVEISLSDSGVAAVGVTITADSSSCTTNSQGYLVLMVQGFGIHKLIISPDLAHGFTNAVTYTVNVTRDWTQTIIDRGAFSTSMTLDPKSANIFTCINNTVIYHLTYNTSIQRQLNLSISGLPNSFMWQFNPPYVQNNGDTSTLTITTPKYYQQGYYYAPLTFTAWGTAGGYIKYPVGDTGIIFQFCQQTAKELCISSPSPDSFLTVLLS
jgi:hypothetical protein